jgi:hypothetical protein
MQRTQRELDMVEHCMRGIVACGEEERAMYGDQHVNMYYQDALRSLRVKQQGAAERLHVLQQMDTLTQILEVMQGSSEIDNALNNRACAVLGLKRGTSQGRVIAGLRQRLSELENS